MAAPAAAHSPPLALQALHRPIEEALDRILPPADAPPARLHAAMRYAVLGGGKRLRPALVLLVGDMLGAPPATLLEAAAALELVHTYSLVHDDLPALDDDDLRRGRPTLHRSFDEATAILAGDALLTLGLTTLALEPRTADGETRRRAVALVGEAIGSRGMIGGQMDDLEAEHAWPAAPAAALEAIHRRKTGALLTAAVRLGGVYAGVDAELDARLASFGEHLGLMFQIADDILDVEGSAGSLGKTAGKDAAARKLTYPGLFGLEESHRRLGQVESEAAEIASGLPGGDVLRELAAWVVARRS